MLHHAIAGRTGWRWWWEEVVGGRYLEAPEGDRPASTYKHDVELTVRVAAAHPVTAGLETSASSTRPTRGCGSRRR